MPLPKGYTWDLERVNQYQSYQQQIPTREEIEQDQASFDPTADWDYQNDDNLGPQGQALPEGAQGWRPAGDIDWGTGLSGWWKKTMYNVGNAYQSGYQEGLTISSFREKGIKERLGETAGQQEIERLKEESAPKSQAQAEIFGTMEAVKESFNSVLGGVLEGLGMAAVGTEQALGAAGYAITDVATGEQVDWKKNWEAGRLAYAGIFDASIREEMNRRLDAGERGDIAAEAVMIEKPWTLWPQLVGQLVYDPLNVVGAFGKAGEAVKIQKNVAKTFHTIENPVVREIVENAGELSKLDDAGAYGKLDELVKTQQGLQAATAHADDIEKAAGKLEELSKSYKLSSMTSSGKISHLANQTSEIMMHVVNNAGPDEALEILQGMVKSVSKDPTDAAEGVSAMLKFADAPALFSEAGNNTTVVLSRMFEKYGDDWLKTLEELKGNPTELTKNLLGKLDDVGQEMFPSVSKMLEAEDAVKKGGEITEATKKLAERARQLPEYVKAATRFHDKAQKVVGPVNKVFAGLYMGWNPGYAFRNWSNNTMQLLLDHGPGVLLGKADDVFASAEKLHGGIIQGAFGFGDKLGEDVASGATDVASTLKKIKSETKGLTGPAQILGGQFEVNAAKRVIAKSYKDTFNKGVQAMTKALGKDLKAAGFSDDLIAKLPTYITQNQGDAKAVINALRKDVSSGVIDLFNDIDRIDPKYKAFLSDAGKWDEYAEKVLKASTPEEATSAAQKIFDDLAQASDYVYREGRPATDNYDKFLKMAEGGGLSEPRGYLIGLRKSTSRDAIKVAENILAEADDMGAKLGLEVGSMKKARNITGLNTWGADAAKEADRINDIAIKLYKTEMRKPGANLNQLWLAYPEFFPGAPPAGLTRDVFTDALWTKYDEIVSRTWGQARDLALENATGYLDDLKAAGAPIKDEWYDAVKTAQEGAQQYDAAKVGRFGEIVPEEAVPYGTRKSQIAELANKYGIPTATEKGVPGDKKTLQIIKKYAEVDYKSLEEVPLSVAEEAFKKKAGVLPTPTATAGTSLADATSLPRSELPEQVSQRFADEAKRLASELSGGEAGRRTAEGTTGSTNAPWYRELYQKGMRKPAIDKALDKIVMDAGADKGVNVERMKEVILDNFKFGDKVSGTPPDLFALRELGADEKTLQEALDNFNDITGGNYSMEDAVKASAPSGTTTEDATSLLHDPDQPYFNEAGELVEPKRQRILPPASDGNPPTAARAIHEQMEDVAKMRQWVMDDITQNFGKKQLVGKVEEKALRLAEKELTAKIAETRLISSRVAQHQRDFTLLNYGAKSYWDTALAYLYPYHYWYKGTYMNWMKRLVTDPSILAHYNRYKENLATVHAGMPDWWKYNMNTNDLPGVHVDNPLYFNLEATLWPLNGLTGTDFNDPSKRVNWWTSTLDFANKFGPSTWSPINIITGLALYSKGEKEAGEKWMGRLLPQSNVIKAAGSLLGVANLETDPLVKFLEGGLDPYERRRVQRALAEMEQQSIQGQLPYSREQIQDAAYSQNGEVWDEAVKRAVHGRANSQISSFLFGVGFKGRTEEDMQIDKFMTDYSKLWTMRPNLTEQEFRDGMSKLKDTYPFMDTVMLSRRDDVNRDAGLAYVVMQRIPPGKSSEIAKAAGIDPKLLDRFYADKGQIDKWEASDRLKFMSGIMSISAVLEIPTDMTRAEWDKAKKAYSGLSSEAKEQFGKDILDLVDGYYQAKTKSYQAGDAYLEKHPEVSQYMNWKAERVMNSDLLSAYYGGASMVEGYYRSKMYSDIEKKLGSDIFDVLDEYNDLKTYGTSAEQKAFYNKNKSKIKQYYSMKDGWAVYIDQQVAELSAHIPEGEGPGIREDYNPYSPTQSALAGAVTPQEQPALEDFQSVIPERLQNLMNDYFQNGDRLPESAEKQLSRIANEMGYSSVQDLLQAYGTSLYQVSP
jgi:hypothetical protein